MDAHESPDSKMESRLEQGKALMNDGSYHAALGPLMKVSAIRLDATWISRLLTSLRPSTCAPATQRRTGKRKNATSRNASLQFRTPTRTLSTVLPLAPALAGLHGRLALVLSTSRLSTRWLSVWRRLDTIRRLSPRLWVSFALIPHQPLYVIPSAVLGAK